MILSYVFSFWRVLKKRSGDVEDVIVGWLVSWNMQFLKLFLCVVWVWIVGDLKLKLLN